MKNQNILVFPCGSEIALEIHRSLKYAKDITLFGDSTEPSNPGKYVFENYTEELPYVKSPDFIERLNDYIQKYHIDMIFPAHDDVCDVLANNHADIYAKVIGSAAETATICRSKRLTYEKMQDIIPVPQVYDFSVQEFPVFLKPDKGQGSKGTFIAHNEEDLTYRTSDGADWDYLVLEYLPGEEYTIDCFTDAAGELRFAKGRRRNRILNGISSDTFTVDNPVFWEYAEKINATLELWGAWFFQLKRSKKGVLTLMEIAPRIAGSMALHRNLGVNFGLLSVYTRLGMDVEIKPNTFNIRMDRYIASRFHTDVEYDIVYVDLDDTLIVRDRVNTQLVSFLYQCINEGKELVLLTRNGAPIEKLQQYRLGGIFNRGIAVPPDKSKADFVTGRAIFIDDSFSERASVQHLCPVFNVSEVECLIK